ncbi:uncharacterized protein TrAtP1_002393 [Trichoderma atroviride]|uniref:uncharacterized protein n=1 Tax=Hypocrea atroviridis TaxID=63577 RepID=UPI00331CD57B|nr:hypothetical protein TrAtP1_002393 [Trichoderma atroviride]
MEKFHRFKPNCTLPNDVPVGFVNAPNIRTTMQIIWSCFSVILLCTWSILRPNVPPELKTKGLRQAIYKKLFLLSRKVYWAGVMLIAPEFLTTFTTKKMFGTKQNVETLKALTWKKTEWGLPQTILADMGGIVIDFSNVEDRGVNNEKIGLEKSPESRPNHEIPTLSQEVPPEVPPEVPLQREDTMIYNQEAQNSGQEVLGPYLEVIRSPTETESQPLRQPSKAYFITEFERRQSRWLGGCEIPWKRHEPHERIAIKVKEALEKEAVRLHEDLPYWKVQNIASLSGSLWTLDSKQLAIAIAHGVIADLPDIKTAEIDDKNKSDALVKVLAVMQVAWMVIQLCARVYYHHPFAPLELGTVAFSATAIILYIVEWDKPKDINTPFYVKAASASVSKDAFTQIVEAAPFPYMQFPFVQYKHYYMPSVAFHETYGSLKVIDAKSFVVAMITVVSFGGIHLLAWNLQFPTPVEGLLWKISAIMTIACPTLYGSSHLPWLGKNPKDATKVDRMMIKAVVGFTSFFYFFARLFLITECIRSLYYLPRGAYIATWTADFPHLS